MTCKGCNKEPGDVHSPECMFEHFMAYTGGHNETPEVQEKLKTAYLHGYSAGEHPNTVADVQPT